MKKIFLVACMLGLSFYSQAQINNVNNFDQYLNALPQIQKPELQNVIEGSTPTLVVGEGFSDQVLYGSDSKLNIIDFGSLASFNSKSMTDISNYLGTASFIRINVKSNDVSLTNIINLSQFNNIKAIVLLLDTELTETDIKNLLNNLSVSANTKVLYKVRISS